jgi:hypothetical protein
MVERMIPDVDDSGRIMLVQWCAPFLLQQAGRLASEPAAMASTGEISGRLKRRSRTMLRARRTRLL